MKRALFLLLFVLTASPAFGQVAFDAVSSASGLSVSHTRGAISNPYALACVNNGRTAQDTTAVSYGGIPMDFIHDSAVGGIVRASLFGLAAPLSGAQTVAVTNGDSETTIAVATLSGVHQTAPTGTSVASSASGVTSASVDITVTVDGLAVDCLVSGDPQSLNPGAGQTERAEVTDASITSALSTEGGSGTVTMSYSWSVSTYRTYIAVPLEPAVAPSVSTLSGFQPMEM